MPISQTDFDDACDELLLAGETPTIERMRAAIGGGSPGTVGPMLKTWKARRAEEDALRDIPIPASLSDDAALTLARLWTRAMAEATAGHDAMRRDLVTAKAEIATLHEDYLGQLCRMEVDLDRVQTERDAHRDRVERPWRPHVRHCPIGLRARRRTPRARLLAWTLRLRTFGKPDRIASPPRVGLTGCAANATRPGGGGGTCPVFGQTAGCSAGDGCARCAGRAAETIADNDPGCHFRETPESPRGTRPIEASFGTCFSPEAAHRGARQSRCA